MKSILQAWVTELGLRHQGVLLTAVRGCDTWSKYSAEKPLIREMRGLILVAFDPRELEFAEGFMTRFPNPNGDNAFQSLLSNIDGLPVHYVMHVMHAVEILGFKHPDKEVRSAYQDRYARLAEKFHLYPEDVYDMDERLTEDRIQEGTVEQ
jgi:hypothetical protein